MDKKVSLASDPQRIVLNRELQRGRGSLKKYRTGVDDRNTVSLEANYQNHAEPRQSCCYWLRFLESIDVIQRHAYVMERYLRILKPLDYQSHRLKE